MKPGVHTAHYSGSRDAVDNMTKVLSEIQGENDRTAQFRAVMTYIDGSGNAQQFEGIVEGSIALKMSGAEGFGYDPIFIPEGHSKTFADLSSEIKNQISHRKRALSKLVGYLQNNS